MGGSEATRRAGLCQVGDGCFGADHLPADAPQPDTWSSLGPLPEQDGPAGAESLLEPANDPGARVGDHELAIWFG
jgi:hypothetical protein